MDDIHTDINKQLDHFYNNNMIPNIIFHGPSGSGKSTIVSSFLQKIYNNNNQHIKNFVMLVNCAHGKGIKFIREDLKLFSKINVPAHFNITFKTIILLNADNLTTDAQSALRRCIELFSHATRFFIIVEDKCRLLKPILSRFCEIYVPYPKINGVSTNLHIHYINTRVNISTYENERIKWLQKTMTDSKKKISYIDIISLADKMYNKGYSGLDIINYLNKNSTFDLGRKYDFLMCINKIKKEFRNEKMIMFFILSFILIRSDITLENLLVM